MSKESVSIEKYKGRYRKFGLNLTALKVLCTYVKDHPNKSGILLYDNTKKNTVDPVLLRMREKDKIKELFSTFSLYGIVLVNTNKEKYLYMGRYVNGTLISIEVDKEIKGKHIPLLVSVIMMLEKVEEDFNKTYKEPQLEKLSSAVSDITDIEPKTIVENLEKIENVNTANTIPQEINSIESLKDFDFSQMRRNMTFHDLPPDLQKVIKETIPFPNA
jgi:hypothetical protein